MSEQVLYLKRGGDANNPKDWEECKVRDRYCQRHAHVDDVNKEAYKIKTLKLDDTVTVVGVSIEEYNIQMTDSLKGFAVAEKDFDNVVDEVENKKWGWFAKEDEKLEFYNAMKTELLTKAKALEDAYWNLVSKDQPRIIGEGISRFDNDYKYQDEADRRRSRISTLSDVEAKINNFLAYGKYKK